MKPGRLWLPGDLEVTGCDPARLARFMYAVRKGRPLAPIAGAASFSDYAENAVLGHITGKSAMAMPSVYLALCTSIPTDTSTGTTIVEASYTGYARQAVAAGSWGAASAGAIANSAQLTFGACTAGSSTIIGWALCDALTVGNSIMWGTCSSTVISTTQTPPTVAAAALSLTLD